MDTFLTVPTILRPPYQIDQAKALDWLAAAHSTADSSLDPKLIKKLLNRYGCGPEKIGSRGTFLEDATHNNWDQMQIFRFDNTTAGENMSKRMEFYANKVDRIFEDFYKDENSAPENLIHVSCTGYVSPSGAQKLASQKKWSTTTITHAYHMGCYAAVPAIRMADGFSQATGGRADIVHTELCTLHMNPRMHEPEQLVVQSLFADGLCKYSVDQKKPTTGFKILKYKEEILPDTANAMTWSLADFGMRMTLHRDVPEMIRNHLPSFVNRLTDSKNNNGFEFAVHPGGPKIIEGVQTVLGLEDLQVQRSKETLFKYGNMSSATLPHVWESIAQQDGPDRIVSLAFGPGLTVCGLLLERV